MRDFSFVCFASIFFITGCTTNTQTPDAAQDPLAVALTGKVLTRGNTEVRVMENKKLVGTTGPNGEVIISGAWEVREGQFCRTLLSPPWLGGTECQDVTIEGDTATFSTSRGEITYAISDS
ncbi:hypothetical protein [Ruegeria arenilitoris]|uniref:hypothetical protein n=1 Tax=Ruegeria arenilitoris TaxID=1173585 RepID=UPI00147D086D|nr:hypothetical protein [Ruegeria arenilitoris]